MRKAIPNEHSRRAGDAIGRDKELAWTTSASSEWLTDDDDEELLDDASQLAEYDTELRSYLQANPSRLTARRLAERIREEIALRKVLEDPWLDF